MTQVPPSKSPAAPRGRPRDWYDKTDQNTIKSLDRAMHVLEHLSARPGLTLSQLSGELGQSPSTIYRILITLETRGLVEFETSGQLWHVGSGAFVIGARYLRRTSLVERARPVLRDLMEATGETANLGIEREGMVLFVSQVETHENIRAFFPPGTLSAMHASGIGKALMAFMEPAKRNRMVARAQDQRFNANTLAGDALLNDLHDTRARRYAVDAEEKSLGMRCIAAPIFDVQGEPVAGISVSGPSNRMQPALTPALAAHVVAAAQRLTEALGGTPPAPSPTRSFRALRPRDDTA